MSEFLICIISCHRYADRRRQQGETWLKECNVDYKYFLGTGQCDEPDTICLPVADDYISLPAKVQAAVRWAKGCGYRQIFKTDDETYVRSERLAASQYDTRADDTARRADYVGKVEQDGTGAQWCNGGPGYWLGSLAISAVAMAPEAGTGAEDKWVASVLAGRNITPQHDTRYSMPGQLRDYPRPDNDIISFTGCCSIDGCPSMYDIHRQWPNKITS